MVSVSELNEKGGCLDFYEASFETPIEVPLFSMSVSAGIPIEANDTIERKVDLNELLIDHPASTIFAKVNGKEMEDVGIKDGDVMVINTALEPIDGRIVVAELDGRFLVKYFRNINGEQYLESQSRSFVPIKLINKKSYRFVGVVTKIIHSF
ncbi:MAG: translesion error-prone DNA polymerase V autoproteolytic subunit [Candidatus Kapaibacteriales bacterium]